jgi:hypothetical protein
MQITRISPFSGKEHTLDVPCTQAQLDAWQAGEYIQNALPQASAAMREFVKTGITPQEWNETFGDSADNN